MNIKLWIVTAVDHGETCDGKARVLEVCKSKEEANAFVRSDIEKWADDRATEDIYVDFAAMAAGYNRNADEGCEWNIEERLFNVIEEDEQANVIDDGQLEFDFKEV